MFDIITFGSATQDIIVKPKYLTSLKYEKEPSHQEVCFPFGSKIEVADIKFNSGGGGTNTAASFALQGFKTAFCGMVGPDVSGKEIINELKRFGINTKLVVTTKEKTTNHSIVISGDGKDRTILAYRGAAELLGRDQIPWRKLKAKWLYIAPLSGMLCDSFGALVDYAKEKGMKVAVNPSMAQLSLPYFADIAKKIDVLFLNQEEASFLTKTSLQERDRIFTQLDALCPGVAVMTMGGEGVMVSDGKILYSAVPPTDRKIVDTTGAGDAFASGFISAYMRGGDIESAIQLGMANSVGCIAAPGAKNGLLKRGQEFNKVEAKREII